MRAGSWPLASSHDRCPTLPIWGDGEPGGSVTAVSDACSWENLMNLSSSFFTE